MEIKMASVKTTINVDAELWRDFSIQVIKYEGYRKKSDVIEELIREYVEQKRGEKQNE
jgi:metal-responsive CopG/Arc/MetJ family transcriptional regulator